MGRRSPFPIFFILLLLFFYLIQNLILKATKMHNFEYLQICIYSIEPEVMR
jgi:hypothetical protein